MRISGKFILSGGAALMLAACAGKDDEKKAPFGPTGIPQQLQAKAGTSGGTAVAPGGNAEANIFGMTPQEDIAWTGFDGEGIPELETLMASPKKGPWEDSITVARQTAAREGKPVLIWFTDSARSPMCKALSQELFATASFGNWAEDKIVRLRVDSNVDVDDPSLSLDEKINRQTDMKNYIKVLKKRYKVMGHPTILMLNPSGEVLWKDTGYKRGEADFLWGLIKQAEVASSHQYESWRKGLEGKGYREWEGKRGKKVFAKLVSYSKGTLILIEPGGERYKTSESRLSKDDMKWIDEQKNQRGIQ